MSEQYLDVSMSENESSPLGSSLSHVLYSERFTPGLSRTVGGSLNVLHDQARPPPSGHAYRRSPCGRIQRCACSLLARLRTAG